MSLYEIAFDEAKGAAGAQCHDDGDDEEGHRLEEVQVRRQFILVGLVNTFQWFFRPQVDNEEY